MHVPVIYFFFVILLCVPHISMRHGTVPQGITNDVHICSLQKLALRQDAPNFCMSSCCARYRQRRIDICPLRELWISGIVLLLWLLGKGHFPVHTTYSYRSYRWNKGYVLGGAFWSGVEALPPSSANLNFLPFLNDLKIDIMYSRAFWFTKQIYLVLHLAN